MTAIDLTITINSVAIQTAIFFGLVTVYASAYTKMPRHSIIFVVLWVLFALPTIFFPFFGEEYAEYAFYIYALILSIEILRVVIKSLIIV